MSLFSDVVEFATGREADKALGQPNPDGETRPAAPEVYGAAISTTAGSRYSGSSARRQLEAYGAGNSDSIDWIADCLDVICGTASTADKHLENTKGERVPMYWGEAEHYEHRADPWMVQLLEEPNSEMLWEELIFLAVLDRVLTGDAFILMHGEDQRGRPLALYRLPPDQVEVLPSRSGRRVDFYEYKVPGEVPVKFPSASVIHWRAPNPHDPYRGIGLLAKGPRVFDTEIALTETKASYYEQGAKLQGVLESDNAISDTTAQKIRRQFQGLYGGARRAFQVAVLGRGLKYQTIQSNAVEGEFVTMTELSRDRILAAMRVPRGKLGIPNDTSATTAPAEERRTFANDVMRPLLNELQTLLTRDLTMQYGYKLCIEYEYQMPVEDQYKLAGELAKAPGVTVREVRERYGLSPLHEVMDDEDEAKEIEELVLNMPGADENGSDVKDRGLPGEAGRPAAGTNTATFQERDAKQSAAIR